MNRNSFQAGLEGFIVKRGDVVSYLTSTYASGAVRKYGKVVGISHKKGKAKIKAKNGSIEEVEFLFVDRPEKCDEYLEDLKAKEKENAPYELPEKEKKKISKLDLPSLIRYKKALERQIKELESCLEAYPEGKSFQKLKAEALARMGFVDEILKELKVKVLG